MIHLISNENKDIFSFTSAVDNPEIIQNTLTYAENLINGEKTERAVLDSINKAGIDSVQCNQIPELELDEFKLRKLDRNIFKHTILPLLYLIYGVIFCANVKDLYLQPSC